MADTDISWASKVWNFTRGCRRTAPKGSNQSGCGDPSGGGCYAERQANRFAFKGGPYEGLVKLTKNGPRWTGKGRFVAEKLVDPLKWRKPERIFPDSMSDLFYDAFSFEEIAAGFGVMAACPQHTFLLLTKRVARAREFFAWLERYEPRPTHRGYFCWGYTRNALHDAGYPIDHSVWDAEMTRRGHDIQWPLPNVWMGASVENQAAADDRIPDLLMTPAAIHWLSIEPLLGPVDLHAIQIPGELEGLRFSCLQKQHDDRFGYSETTIDWVVIGCESGPRARECDSTWIKSLVDQCVSASTPVPVWLKQAEETADCGEDGLLQPGDDDTIAFGAGSVMKGRRPGGNHIIELPYLDGVQYKQLPAVAMPEVVA